MRSIRYVTLLAATSLMAILTNSCFMPFFSIPGLVTLLTPLGAMTLPALINSNAQSIAFIK